MLQASELVNRPRRQQRSCTAAGLELQNSDQEDDDQSSVRSPNGSLSVAEDNSCDSPLPVIDKDVLQLANASRAEVVETKKILSTETIEQMQSAVLQRMADQLSEQELLKLQDERMENDPIKCWCCDRFTQPPALPLSDEHIYPVFVISTMPEWMIPALHCGNADCPGRQLGLQAKPKYGDGMTFEHAGLLTALYIQRQWRPLSWFLTRDATSSEEVTEVDSGLTLRRITLAILFRVMKPFDDFSEESERQRTSKEPNHLQALSEEDDRSNQENMGDNRSPNLQPQSQPDGSQIELTFTAKNNPLQFEECRRSLQVEELDGCARIIWNGTNAAGFCTYSVRMDATYGVYAMLNGIYVRRCFRRRGLAREAIRDFFRVIAPRICQRRNSTSEMLMAIQAPVTKLILTVITNSLEPIEMSRIKCVRAQCPLALSVSVKSWSSMNRFQ